MSLFTNISKIFKRSSVDNGTARYAPRMGSVSLINTTPMCVSTVFACVQLLSRAIATLPMVMMRRKGSIYVPMDSGKINYLLQVSPNEGMSAIDFWELAVRHLLLRGNVYIVPIYSTLLMDIDELRLVNPDRVLHNTATNTYEIDDPDMGVKGVFAESEVIHVKNITLDGKKGLSTLAYARETIDIAAAGNTETLERFTNGGSVRGIVSNDNSVRGFGEYQDQQLADTAQDLDSRYRNGERIVSLPGQVQFTSVGLTSADMQFLESRKFTVQEICRFFSVHPSFVSADAATNYKSAENANVAFLTYTLNPLLRKFEVEFMRKLVTTGNSANRKLEFDRKGLFACDLSSKADYQNKTISSGIYTVNEWRMEENKEPVDGGDTPLVSANLRTINELNQKDNG